jgi:hypothetical protein
MKNAMIMPLLAILLGLAPFVGAVQIVHAGHHGCAMFSASISDMDIDNDGTVSFNEYAAFHSGQLRWSFNVLDTDNDGSISTSEWDTFLKMHGIGKGYESNQQG